MQCFFCNKKLEDAGHPSCVKDAGSFKLSFGYGSNYDQCGYSTFDYINLSRIDRLLICDEIEGYLCDDCFEKNHYKLQGIKVEKHHTKSIEVKCYD